MKNKNKPVNREMDRGEFQLDLNIDPGHLDVECVRQGDLFFKWAERSVEAKARVDRLDLRCEVTEAKLQAEIRLRPSAFGLDPDKVTEAGVKAAVIRSQRLRDVKVTHLEAKKEAALLEKAVTAMDVKKRMIESLVTLHGQNYFAGPSTPNNLLEAWDKYQARIGKSVTERQRKMLKKRKVKRES